MANLLKPEEAKYLRKEVGLDDDEKREEDAARGADEVDWATFDFAAEEAKNSPESSFIQTLSEVDLLFEPIVEEEEDSESGEAGEELEKAAEETVGITNSAQVVTSQTAATQKGWKTPLAWPENPLYLASVGHDEWGSYDEGI